MASSKDVLAVLGKLCVCKKFRSDFFVKPEAMAESLVGKMRPDEVEQILGLAGAGKLPEGFTRETFVKRLQEALDTVYAAASCPTPPCPDDPDDPPKA
jgi:hypothetical protein